MSVSRWGIWSCLSAQHGRQFGLIQAINQPACPEVAAQPLLLQLTFPSLKLPRAAGWVCAAHLNSPSSVSVAIFCQRPSGVPVCRSSISQCPVLRAALPGSGATSPGCSMLRGAGRASLNWNGICSSDRSAQGQRSQAKFQHIFLSRREAQSVGFAGNHLECFSWEAVSDDGVPSLLTPGALHIAATLPAGASFPLTQSFLLSPSAPTAPWLVPAVLRSQGWRCRR